MSKDVVTCGPHDHVAHAAQLMWDHDCGVLPVVDQEEHVIGVLTDRDVCMGAYTTGARLGELPVLHAMAREVACCHADDRVEAALERMAEVRVRRLPIVDEERRIVGLLSLNDVLRRIPELPEGAARRALSEATLQALARICEVRERTVELTPPKPAAKAPAKPRAKASAKASAKAAPRGKRRTTRA
jgi:CBS-domain-containing membrane protein